MVLHVLVEVRDVFSVFAAVDDQADIWRRLPEGSLSMRSEPGSCRASSSRISFVSGFTYPGLVQHKRIQPTNPRSEAWRRKYCLTSSEVLVPFSSSARRDLGLVTIHLVFEGASYRILESVSRPSVREQTNTVITNLRVVLALAEIETEIARLVQVDEHATNTFEPDYPLTTIRQLSGSPCSSRTPQLSLAFTARLSEPKLTVLDIEHQ